MEIPKYVDKLILRRAHLAEMLNDADYKLCEWLDKNEITTQEYDIRTGCEMYVNPYASADRIRQAIREAGKENGRNR